MVDFNGELKIRWEVVGGAKAWLEVADSESTAAAVVITSMVFILFWFIYC